MFSLKNRRKEIDIIKFSYENLQYLNLSIHEALLSELKYLKSMYARTGTSDYLLLAFLHIQSFLELGFCYEEHESIFDELVHLAGLERREAFPNPNRHVKKVKLNNSQVRSMIGRWPASPYNSHTISEAMEDIIAKVKSHSFGTYFYYTASSRNSKLCYTGFYCLTVRNDEAVFYDVSKRKFYMLDTSESE